MLREFLFRQIFGSRRPLGHDEVTYLGRAVPDANVDVVGHVAAHLF
jgi:hypothetical protein